MQDSLAYQIAEVQITYRPAYNVCDRPIIKRSQDAYDILIKAWDENKIGFIEQAKLLLLNRANSVIGIFDVSTGGATGTIVDPKIIFVSALKANACSIILAHNHPSGNLQPSQADISLTQKIKEGGKLLDIAVHDHLIVTPAGFYSFADEYGL